MQVSGQRGGDRGPRRACTPSEGAAGLSSSQLFQGSVNPMLPDLQIFEVKPEIWVFMWNLLVFKRWQPI